MIISQLILSHRLPGQTLEPRLALRKSLTERMAKLGKRQLLNAQGGRLVVPAATVWIPVTHSFETHPGVDCQTREPTSPQFDSSETESQRSDLSKVVKGVTLEP